MAYNRKWIQNGLIITPDRVAEGSLLIENGLIKGLYPLDYVIDDLFDTETIDASGCYVMAGIIDMHSDAMEKEVQPRPNTFFPLQMSFFELEKKLAASGITTIYHSLSLADGVGVRQDDMIVDIVKHINKLSKERSMIHHHIHLRYEITNLTGINTVRDLILSKQIKLLSYMDHTPGQGQFTKPESYENYLIKTYGIRGEELQLIVEKLQSNSLLINWEELQRLAEEAAANGIILASHDDDSQEKIDLMAKFGITISEFPIHMEAAAYAWELDLMVCVGSPNLVRGQSHSNNMRAIDAIQAGYANIICSDYLPSSMLPSVFILHQRDQVPLHEAAAMVTINPAKGLGVSDRVGSLEPGKQADILIVELFHDYPLVRQTMVCGEIIYSTKPFHTLLKESVHV